MKIMYREFVSKNYSFNTIRNVCGLAKFQIYDGCYLWDTYRDINGKRRRIKMIAWMLPESLRTDDNDIAFDVALQVKNEEIFFEIEEALRKQEQRIINGPRSYIKMVALKK